MIASDQEVNLFEYMLQRMLQRYLDPALTGASRRSAQYYALKPLLPAVYILLSGLARFGSNEAPAITAAYQTGLRELPAGEHPAEPLLPEECGLVQIDAALTQLQLSSPAIKRMVLQAGSACVGADRTVTMEEAELLRAVADSLDCPLPPFLDVVAA